MEKNNISCGENNVRAIAELEYLEIASDSPGETLRERQTEINGGNRELPLDFSHWFYMSRQQEENEL